LGLLFSEKGIMKNKSLENLLQRHDRGHPIDEEGNLSLRVVSKIKKDKKIKNLVTQMTITIKCSDCDNKLKIYLPVDYEDISEESNRPDDFMEINGVMARLEEWREVLLPILNVDYISNNKKKGKLLKLINK
jgi:hypothetical protein